MGGFFRQRRRVLAIAIAYLFIAYIQCLCAFQPSVPVSFRTKQEHHYCACLQVLQALQTNVEAIKQDDGAVKKYATTIIHPKPLSIRAGFGFLYYSFRGQSHKYLARLQEQHGENFIIWKRFVVIHEPAAIRDVLETYNLPKTPQVRKGYKTIFGKKGGILAAPWKKWLEQRRMVAPALAESVIGELSPKFEEASRPFFAHLEDAAATGQLIEMDASFTAVSLDIIGKVLLNRSFGMMRREGLNGDEDDVPFASALSLLTGEALRQMVLPRWMLKLSRSSRQVPHARKVVNNFLEECIDIRLAEQNKTHYAANTTDLLEILLAAEADGLIDRDDVKGQLLTFIFAGHDTTAHTLSFLLWEVSQNPDLQADLAMEAKAALPNRTDFPYPDILAKQLPLLDRSFSETLRKHPAAATGTARQVGARPLVVGNGLELPPRVSVSIPPYSLHRNERYWPNPEVFDPSRFETDLIEPFSFQPFSGGPRNCIGGRLARAEALSLIAPLLRRYEVRCDSKEEPADYHMLTRKPKYGIYFTLVPRPV